MENAVPVIPPASVSVTASGSVAILGSSPPQGMPDPLCDAIPGPGASPGVFTILD